MQSDRLILGSAVVALLACSIAYGCAGKSVGSSGASGGSAGVRNRTEGHTDGNGFSTADGTAISFGGTRTDGGIHGDGTGTFYDGGLHSDGTGIPYDGGPYFGGDGAFDPADGHADGVGEPQQDGTPERLDGAPSAGAPAYADGWPGG